MQETFNNYYLTLTQYMWFNVFIKPYKVIKFFIEFTKSYLKKDLSKKIDIYISTQLSAIERLFLHFDILLSNILFGSSIDDYFIYNFWNMPVSQKKEFLTLEQRTRFYNAFNPMKYKQIFRDKYQTYKWFGKYFGREIILVSESMTFETFKDFCLTHQEIFLKPKNLSQGRGARKIKIDETINLESLFQECLATQMLVEEVIVQHPEMKAFHPNSLNTLRIHTVVTKNFVKIMRAAIRMGIDGSVIDNWSAGGMWAEINIDTGHIYTSAIDKFNNTFEVHPSSNQKIIGSRIPQWDEIKELVLELALVIPQNRLVGWDLAITDKNKIVLVEANECPLLYSRDFGNRKMYEDALRDI